MAGPGSHYNLANTTAFPELWQSDLYDLRTWENGLCHTYSPSDTSSPAFTDRLYFLLLDKNDEFIKTRDNYFFNGFDIFIHGAGQFWPRSEMVTFGQSDKVHLKVEAGNGSGVELELLFTRKVVKKLSTKDRPCREEESYSFTSCLRSYIQRTSGCSVQWFHDLYEEESNCPVENLEALYDLLIWARETTMASLSAVTGCLPRCQVTQFGLEKKSETRINWATNWTSSVYLEPKTSFYETQEEYYSYGTGNFLGDVGGYLGLLLGWSVLTIFQELPKMTMCLASALQRKYLGN